MGGYLHDPLADINLIADNLRDRYKSGFPVLKEIIQNADDAGKGDETIQLEFGRTSGIPEAQHPLLRGPALYFINNGKFEAKDRRAIRSFGLNSKAAEQNAIGKFGLGMKSVFHFCEAFFFLARGEDKQEYAEILNPWSSSTPEVASHHADWDDFCQADQKRMSDLLEPVLRSLKNSTPPKTAQSRRISFFLLWLPLRKKAHLKEADGSEVGSIIHAFPGDPDGDTAQLAFLDEPDLARRMAELMPLLRRITRIRYWASTDAPAAFTVALHPKSSRIHHVLDQAGGSNTGQQLFGVSEYAAGQKSGKHFTAFAGRENLATTPELLNLKRSPLWPKTFVRNEQGHSETAPDKAIGHCAAIFSSSNEKKDEARFTINWAVFLPIGEDSSDRASCEGKRSFSLTLHGYFFVDAGRVDIKGLQSGLQAANQGISPETEEELHLQWNGLLAQQGTLPLILPALADFVERCDKMQQTRLSAEDRWNLSQGLKNSKIFKTYRSFICADSSWVCALTPKGQEWLLVPSVAQLRSLPEPPKSDPERPWKVFPVLQSMESNESCTILLHTDAPHLSSQDVPQWKPKELLTILQLDVKTVFADQGQLDYLIQFLNDKAVRPLLNKFGELQRCLQMLFKIAFTEFGSLGLGKQRSRVQEFVSFISPENRYPVSKNLPDPIKRVLQDSVSSVLVLPDEFDSQEEHGSAKLEQKDALALLQKIHSFIVQHDQGEDGGTGDTCRELAGHILGNQGPTWKKELLKDARDLKILSAYDAQQGKKTAVSLAELESRKQRGLLFRSSPGLNEAQWGLAPVLQAAIQEQILVISRETVEFVFGISVSQAILPCTPENALDSLIQPNQDPVQLQGKDQRQKLIQATSSVEFHHVSSRRARAMRYLLHGRPEYVADIKDPLWVSGPGQNDVWMKIWRHLQQDSPTQWTLLDSSLVQLLPGRQYEPLCIKEIKDEGILRELDQRGPEKLKGLELGQDERDTVLRKAAEQQDEGRLWCRLPLHKTEQGTLVAVVQDKTYLATAPLPTELAAGIDLITLADDRQSQESQQKWIAPINPENITRIALRQAEPARSWRILLDQFDQLSVLELENLHNDLAGKAWLLDSKRNPVKPEDVIALPKMADEVNQLLSTYRGVFSSPENLLEDIRQHRNFQQLEAHFSAEAEGQGMNKLALLLEGSPEYRLGALKLREKEAADLKKIARVCAAQSDSAELRLPGWRLLYNAAQVYPNDCKVLLDALCQPIPADKMYRLLHKLQQEQERISAKGEKKLVLDCFNLYLQALVEQEGQGIHLKGLKLLNQKGAWMDSRILCAEAEGISAEYLLDREQTRLLRKVIVHANQPAPFKEERLFQGQRLQEEIAATPKRLREYFQDWQGLVPDELVCVFLLLLGADPEMRKLAAEFRGRRSIEGILEGIDWQVPDHMDEDGRQEWLYGKKKDEAFANFSFMATCAAGEKEAEVNSILGETVRVPLSGNMVSLLAGGLSYTSLNAKDVISIKLLKPDMNTSSDELSRYLKASAERLLREAYNQKTVDLSTLWAELDQSDQLDIRIAVELILKDAPSYLRLQLGIHKDPQLSGLFQEWDEARRATVEFEETKTGNKVYKEQEQEQLQKIRDLIISDTRVQKNILESVRKKVRSFQYTPASIPFELFQNADDAVMEALEMQYWPASPQKCPDDLQHFVVLQDEQTLSFLHWGRRVNETGVGEFPGRKRGFHQDLEKMLILSASDKVEAGSTTGKFGLGFKSVFLVCDKPRLVSGRLSTEIVAGLYPQPLEDAQSYREKLQARSKRLGTLVDLPLTEATPEEVTKTFNHLSGLLVIFAKQIRRIEVEGPVSERWVWQPDCRPCAPATLELGDTRLGTDQEKVLYWRFSGNTGGILLGMGPKGFRALPQDLPGLWVLAPTEEMRGLGLAINGSFDLDPGRVRLPGADERNLEKAAELGRKFGEALVSLRRQTQEDWETLRHWLHLEADLTEYAFWFSLWLVLLAALAQRHEREIAHRVVVRVLAEKAGLSYFLDQAEALPNGLWDKYQRLIRPTSVKTVVKGLIAEEAVFHKLCEWDFFCTQLGNPEEAMSERIFKKAKAVVPAFGQADFRFHPFGLFELLSALKRENLDVPPKLAEFLGDIFQFFTDTQESEKERSSLKEILKVFRFQAQDGAFYPCKDLLLATSKEDEGKRAAFAPPQYVLAEAYSGNGLDFFRQCREKLSLSPEKMGDWLRAANTPEQQSHALRYLLDGEHGETVAAQVRESKSGWLIGLCEDSACFQGWERGDIIDVLLRKLSSHSALENRWLDTFQRSEPPRRKPPAPADKVLKKIEAWWQREKTQYLQYYERRIYPGNITFDFTEYADGHFDRSSWLALFVLGHLHTMGGQRDEQHREFVSQCVRQGWWIIFSTPNPEDHADEWMRVLESYVEAQVDESLYEHWIEAQVDESLYEHWMNHFPIIYKLARYLDVYREAFLSIDRVKKPLGSLDVILKPRNAPPIDRTLGLGVCFVLRELRRKGILQKDQVAPWCYVPVKRVRDFCANNLDCWGLSQEESRENRLNDSRVIFEKLSGLLGSRKRASFDNCYDIPLQILAEKPDVFQSILS